ELKEGTDDEAKAGQTVEVHYTGWLKDGKKFDSSKDRGQPFEFPLGAGRVIKGWDEGVAGMKVGGKRKLIIPADLAYGKRVADSGLIPPDDELTFEVELLGIKKYPTSRKLSKSCRLRKYLYSYGGSLKNSPAFDSFRDMF